MKYLIIQFEDDKRLAVPITSHADVNAPTFKIVESDTDTDAEGFRSIFELAERASPVALTEDLQSTLIKAIYEYVTEGMKES